MRLRRLIWLSLPLAVAALAIAPSSADAAGYTAYVGCTQTAQAAPAHACQIGDEPGAFFESDEETKYEVCVTFPNAETLCSEEEFAAGGTLYVNAITTELLGSHLVTWYVEGTEVASWSFRMEEPPPAPPPSPVPAPTPTSTPPQTAPPPVPNVIACASGYEGAFSFVSQPHGCTEYRHHRLDHADEIWMIRLRWHNWGGASATARGRWKYCGMGSCPSGPLSAVAFRPVYACGRYAYTRMRVHLIVRGYRNSTDLLRLPAC